MLTTAEIRNRFLKYFEKNNHKIVNSASVKGPADDPTIMWTNAGMVQFKDVFLGKEKRDYTRATSSQKCIRAGGKHNDLENVGFTARHHTFFEMLGNFSFGDYFKKEAIKFAYELLTNPIENGGLGLDKSRIWISVFGGTDKISADIEAEQEWINVGIPKEKIRRFGEKDNFWQMGDTGPCGPCSEVHYDRGEHIIGDPEPNGKGDRVIEIYNLVFMQYNRDDNGNLELLPKTGVDTGMGLERISFIAQNVNSNYEIDLFNPIFDAIWKLTNISPIDRFSAINKTASQVIADHIRAVTFMIYEGVVPGNEGRGYVLRKIIRRALRFGRKLGIDGLFFYELVSAVYEAMKDAYPELLSEIDRIKKVIKREEKQFSLTLTTGLNILENLNIVNNKITGNDIFKLYDSYGFSVDLVEDWCKEKNIKADIEEYEKYLLEQKMRSRLAMKTHDQRLLGDLSILADLPATEFIGYTNNECEAEVLALFDNNYKSQQSIINEGYVLLNKTVFYAESGGQIGDVGKIKFADQYAEVLGSNTPANKRTLHKIKLYNGTKLSINDKVLSIVDMEKRAKIKVHHSATHLLHAALREVLGSHVKQAGSNVDTERLRFDFSHYTSLEFEQILEIEKIVNEQCLKGILVNTSLMTIEEALTTGAMALFGEKYGEHVRVVTIDDFSKELCGGTHVKNTGEIGFIKIISDSAVSSGIRRIEAVAGISAFERFQQSENLLNKLSKQMNGTRENLQNIIENKDIKIHQMEKEIKELLIKTVNIDKSNEIIEEISGYKLLTSVIELLEGDLLRQYMDKIKSINKDTIIALISKINHEKLSVLVSVPEKYLSKFDASQLLKIMLVPMSGRGGGKKELAQGGATNIAGIQEAFTLLKINIANQ